MLPTKQSKFLPFSEIGNYTDQTKYHCVGIVFSPSTENDHFRGCPPYIKIQEIDDYEDNNSLYFEVPYIIAYYGERHAGYTMRGHEMSEMRGRNLLQMELKKLLNI